MVEFSRLPRVSYFDNLRAILAYFPFERRFLEMTVSSFELAGGSVIGRDHRAVGKNNQDSFYWESEGEVVVGFVADGCGDSIDSPHSEVGSQIAVHLVTKTILDNLRRPRAIDSQRFWDKVLYETAFQIRTIAAGMGKSLSEAVRQHFLFTLVGVVITPETTVFVSLGDGVVAINGTVSVLGPYPNNMPPYLGYNLVETSIDPNLTKFFVLETLKTATLESFLIGSDGVSDLASLADKQMPGREELVGSIEQFWTDDRVFGNPQTITRRLRLIADEKILTVSGQVLRYPGLLRDDTTMIVGRRIKTEV